MPLWIDLFFILSHPVHPSPQVGPIVIHHISQETPEEIKTPEVGCIGLLKSQVPLPDDGCVIACLFQLHRNQGSRRIKVTPAVFLLLSDHSGNPNHVGITTREKRSPAGRTYSWIGIKRAEDHPLPGQLIYVRGMQVGGPHTGEITITQIIHQDAENIWGSYFISGCHQVQYKQWQ